MPRPGAFRFREVDGFIEDDATAVVITARRRRAREVRASRERGRGGGSSLLATGVQPRMSVMSVDRKDRSTAT
jgi:hypothetical protein